MKKRTKLSKALRARLNKHDSKLLKLEGKKSQLKRGDLLEARRLIGEENARQVRRGLKRTIVADYNRYWASFT